MLKTFQYRIKDSGCAAELNTLARACNQVWNFCNESQEHALRWGQRWPTAFDLNNLTAGSSKELGLHSQTVNAVCEQYATRRQQFKKRGTEHSSYGASYAGSEVSQESPSFRAGRMSRIALGGKNWLLWGLTAGSLSVILVKGYCVEGGIMSVPATEMYVSPSSDVKVREVAVQMARVLMGTAVKRYGRDPGKWPSTDLTRLVSKATLVLSSSK